MKDWQARVIRTVLQFIAGGGLTVGIDQLIQDIDDFWVPWILIASTLLVTTAQNLLEDAEMIPTIFKPASPPAPEVVEPVQ